MGLPLVSRASTRWIVRAPGRSGVLSPDEAAHALQARRVELRTAVDRRKDARFLSAGVRDEVVDEAIAVVVMSRKPIQNEEHLQGAFWTSVGYLLAERRAGRHELRVGSQRRVAYEPLEGELAGEGEDEPFDFVEARDRVLRAADLISQLDPLERQVLTVMGGYGVGVKRAAKSLDLPVKTVLAASRSANRKLDHVTAILAAGRMCEYRAAALQALAEGTALEEESKVAQAHLDACSACRREHVLLAREMASAQYKRAASAALLPAPAVFPHAHGWLERMLSLAHIRMPGGGASAERAGLMLGGGAGAKVAVAAGVGVLAVAGAGVTAVHSLEGSTPATHHHVVSHSAARTATSVSTSIAPTSEPGALLPARTDTAPVKPTPRRPQGTDRPGHQRPPSRADGYLAIGGSPAATTTATTAKAASTTTSSGSELGHGEGQSSTPPTPTGGGSLNYLGR